MTKCFVILYRTFFCLVLSVLLIGYFVEISIILPDFKEIFGKIRKFKVSNRSETYKIDLNSKCTVHKIKYNNEYAMELVYKTNISGYRCEKEIAPENHIIHIEELIPKPYDGSNELYIFSLKLHRVSFLLLHQAG